MRREELEELFCFKIGRELERFKEEMRELDLEEILARAYQIDTLISIYEILVEISRQIGKEVLERTILFPDLLAFLYDGWMRQEDSHMQELQTAVLGELEEMKKTAGKNEQEVRAA